MDIEKLTHPLKVSKKISETADAVSLIFDIPKNLSSQFIYRPGQFVTIFMKIGGDWVSRSYSISSAPQVDKDFKITIKRVPGGKMSPLLVNSVKAGDELRIVSPAGMFYHRPTDNKSRLYLFFAAGSGITPIYSIAKSVLHENPKNLVQLYYSSKDKNSIIYGQELEAWQKSQSPRVAIEHFLTRESSKPTRMDSVTRQRIFKAATSQNLMIEVFSCGPENFMAEIKNDALGFGIPSAQIHQESFGVVPTLHPPDSRTLIGDKSAERGDKQFSVMADIDGEKIEIQTDGKINILEALMNEGHNPPFSCMSGSCMACMAKIDSGLVAQEDPGILTDDNIEAGECLTCQAVPLSKLVKIRYTSGI